MADRLPLVWVLGTGGTIAAWGAPRLKFFDYGVPGMRLDVHDNLEQIPEVDQFARVKAEHLIQAGSGGLGDSGWLMVAKKVNNLFQDDPDVSGVVVTHGTSSLEETAYWLNLTVKSEKSVVVTGTMRPPSAMGTEAYNNLLGAIILAGSQEARGMGVTVMLNDEINASREVTKQNSYRIQTFGTRELGFWDTWTPISSRCSTGVPPGSTRTRVNLTSVDWTLFRKWKSSTPTKEPATFKRGLWSMPAWLAS